MVLNDLGRSKQHTSCSISEYISGDIQIFPDNKRLDGAEFQTLESIVDTKAVFTGILADFIEVALDQFLLLYELHVGERLCSKFDSLHI